MSKSTFSIIERSRNEMEVTKRGRINRRFEVEREVFDVAECKQDVQQDVAVVSGNVPSTDVFKTCHNLNNVLSYPHLKKENAEKNKFWSTNDEPSSNIVDFDKLQNINNQPCNLDVFLKSEPKEEICIENEMIETKSDRVSQRFVVEKEVFNLTECKQASSTEQENVLESGSIQPPDELDASIITFHDLRNVIEYKNMIKGEELKQRSCSLRGECTSNTLDIKRENDSSWNSNPMEYDKIKIESVDSSPKKYPSLLVSIFEGSKRKVVEQNFDLDSIILQQFDKLTTTNSDNERKCKFTKGEHTISNHFNLNEKQKKYDPLPRQFISTPEEPNTLKGLDDGGNKRIKLQCKNLDMLINKVKTDHVDKKIIEHSIFDSDSESDTLNKKCHLNRKLQAERPSSVLKLVVRKLRKTKKRNLSRCQKRRQKRKRSRSDCDCEDKKLSNSSRNWSLPDVKRLKLTSGKTNVTETWDERIEQENLVLEKILDRKKTRRTGKAESNYLELLNKFTSCSSVRKLRNKSLDLWDTRIIDMLSGTRNVNLLVEFYIPPAQVQLLHQQLTDELPSTECLRLVCESRNWPQPVYKQIPHTTGFLYTCQLKSVEFTPSKPASNHQLAQELAADMFLDWLGLIPRRASSPSDAMYLLQ